MVDELLELPNATACEGGAVDWVDEKVVILSLGVECEEVVKGPKDLRQALGFESILKFQDCLDGDPFARGRGVCGILRKLQVNISVRLESEASLMRTTALRSCAWRVKDEGDKERKLTMLERLNCADILEFADWINPWQRCTPRVSR